MVHEQEKEVSFTYENGLRVDLEESEDDTDTETESEMEIDWESEPEMNNCSIISSSSWMGRISSSKSKTHKRTIRFNERVDVYYFKRCVGGCSIPIQGTPLGMGMRHFRHRRLPLLRTHRSREFQLEPFERHHLLIEEGINLESEIDTMQEIEKIRESRKLLPLCSCGDLGKCGGEDKYACYCTYNEVDCHEWCVCKKYCSHNPQTKSMHQHNHDQIHTEQNTSQESPAALNPQQSYTTVKKVIPSGNNMFGWLGKMQSSGSRMVHAVNGLIFVWLFVNSVQTVTSMT